MTKKQRPVRDEPRGPGAPKGRPGRPSAPPRRDEEIVYGLRASLALIAKRPGDVIAVAHDPAIDLATHRARFPVAHAGPRELERLAGSDHHEGVVVRVRPRVYLPARELSRLLVERGGLAVALDRVRNPYNVGAIIRTAAFFGVDAVLLGASQDGSTLAPLAVRVAEGGTEHVALSRTTDMAQTLTKLRESGCHVIGAESSEARSVYEHPLDRPLVLVLGHEREGISARVRSACEDVVSIPGGGALESLNVSIAASVMIAIARQPERVSRGPR